jgi:hypothetical protein
MRVIVPNCCDSVSFPLTTVNDGPSSGVLTPPDTCAAGRNSAPPPTLDDPAP